MLPAESGTEAPNATFERAMDAGAFMLPVCGECSQAHFPPRILCPHCGSLGLRWEPVSGLGTVYSVSVVPRREGAPTVVALVDLAEGPRLMTNILGPDAAEIAIGASVRAELGVRDGRRVPLFRPVQP